MATADQPAQTFMNALQQFERTADVGPLAALFSPDADARSTATVEPMAGPDGVKRFWLAYLSAFQTVRSTFVHVRAGDDSAVLEWTSEGTLPTGTAINYQGVSLLEFAAGGKVRRFRTYYDSAAFLPSGAKTVGRDAKA